MPTAWKRQPLPCVVEAFLPKQGIILLVWNNFLSLVVQFDRWIFWLSIQRLWINKSHSPVIRATPEGGGHLMFGSPVLSNNPPSVFRHDRAPPQRQSWYCKPQKLALKWIFFNFCGWDGARGSGTMLMDDVLMQLKCYFYWTRENYKFCFIATDGSMHKTTVAPIGRE